MPYDIPGNLQILKEKIQDLENKIKEFKNQLGKVSGDVVKSGTDKEIPVVKIETVSGPVIPDEVNPPAGNVNAKVKAIEQNTRKNLPLLSDDEFEFLDSTYFYTEDLKLINNFLNILTIIQKNSNDAEANLKSGLTDNLKKKYITKGQTLFDETTKDIIDITDTFCEHKDAIKAYFRLYDIIQKFYSNLIGKPSSYGNLYEIMKGTNDNKKFNNYINNLLKNNNTKYEELKKNLDNEKCNVENTKGGRKSRKIKHRKTKRRGKGDNKSHKKRHSKSHKKKH